MKKHILIISSIIVLSTLVNVSALNNTSRLTDVGNITETENSVFRYVLKDYQGQIALFSQEKEKPIEVYDIYTSSLPTEDAAVIKKGILVTESELVAILEQYTS